MEVIDKSLWRQTDTLCVYWLKGINWDMWWYGAGANKGCQGGKCGTLWLLKGKHKIYILFLKPYILFLVWWHSQQGSKLHCFIDV